MTQTASLDFLLALQRIAGIVLFGGFAVMLAAEWLLPAPGARRDLARVGHDGHNLLLWLLHALHHSDPRVDVTTNLRQHPLHRIPAVLWKLAACAAIGVPAWIFLIHEMLTPGFAHLRHAAVRWPRWQSAWGMLLTPWRARKIPWL